MTAAFPAIRLIARVRTGDKGLRACLGNHLPSHP
jgi:hypothetical protein